MAGVTITLPDALLREAEARAARNGQSLSQWLSKQISLSLTTRPAPARLSGSFRDTERAKQLRQLPKERITVF